MIKKSPRLKRSVELLLLGSAAGVAVACGSQVSDLAGDMAEDMGDMLADAGSELLEAGSAMEEHTRADADTDDASTSLFADASNMLEDAAASLMNDAGALLHDAGALLHDAGENAHDGGSSMAGDANAQNGCGSCGPASENPAQLVNGFKMAGGWTLATDATYVTSFQYTAWALYAELTSGPVLLTDLDRTGSVDVYAVPAGTPCVTLVAPNGPGSYGRSARYRPLVLSTLPVHGARIWVAANETLCALAGVSLYSPVNGSNANEAANANRNSNAAVVWSGFRPY